MQLTKRVARREQLDQSASPLEKYPPFKHVIYIIKENRTYDQVLATYLKAMAIRRWFFSRAPISPNHHALAERFGLFDRFFCNAEVSSQGHVWTTAGIRY